MRKRRNDFDTRRRLLYVLWLAAIVLTALVLLYVAEIDRTRTLESFVPVERKIKCGETVWEIADEYVPRGFDKREYIAICEHVNGKNLSYVVPGETVIFYESR